MKFLAAILSAFVIATCVSLTTQSPVPQNITGQVPASSLFSSGLGSLSQLTAQAVAQVGAQAVILPAMVLGSAAAIPSYALAAMSNLQMPVIGNLEKIVPV